MDYNFEDRFRIMKTRIDEFIKVIESIDDIQNIKDLYTKCLDYCCIKLNEYVKEEMITEIQATDLKNSMQGSFNIINDNKSKFIKYLKDDLNKIYEYSNRKSKKCIFKIGQLVKVINATYGWGNVTKDSLADIIAIDNDTATFTLNINGINPNFICSFEDVIANETNVEIDNEIMDFSKKYLSLGTFLVNFLESKKQELTNEHQDLENKLKVLTKNIEQKTKEIDIKSKYNSSMSLEQVGSLIKYLLTNLYESIECENGILKAISNPITIKYKFPDKEAKQNIDLGQYTVNLDLLNNCTISITNIDKYKKGDCIHPHILTNGIPCLGTYSTVIDGFRKKDDYLSILITLYDFLNSVYSEGWYKHIGFWSNEELCYTCMYLKTNCICSPSEPGLYCSNCEAEYRDDCSCDRCPDTDDVVNFPDSYCFRCEHLCKNEQTDSWQCKFDCDKEDNGDFRHVYEPISQIIEPLVNTNRFFTIKKEE